MPARRPRIIAIANQKGGVGKTTTALNLGAGLVRMGFKVLVCDLDPHASATIHLAYYPEKVSASSADLFSDANGSRNWWKELIRQESRHYFDFIPGSIRLAEMEIKAEGHEGSGRILAKRFRKLPVDYDFVLLDCSPHLGLLLINALVAAKLIIIPTQAEFLALHGLRLMFNTINGLNRLLERPLRYKVLTTMFDRRLKSCQRVYGLLENKLGSRLLRTVIHVDSKFREATGQGRLIFDVSPKCRGSKGYLQLAGEISNSFS